MPIHQPYSGSGNVGQTLPWPAEPRPRASKRLFISGWKVQGRHHGEGLPFSPRKPFPKQPPDRQQTPASSSRGTTACDGRSNIFHTLVTLTFFPQRGELYFPSPRTRAGLWLQEERSPVASEAGPSRRRDCPAPPGTPELGAQPPRREEARPAAWRGRVGVP